MQDVNNLKEKFNNIARAVDANLLDNESVVSIENKNEDSLAKLRSVELQVNILKKQVDELDKLNKMLTYDCFTSNVSPNEPKPNLF